MKQFLSIVLRNQFNLFYRFGYTFIPKSGLIVFDQNITNKTKEKIVSQFATITPFDYDEEYLILHFEKSINEKDNFVQFEIQDLVAVYPLSQQAKISIETKIDQRIRLEKPIFETILPKIEFEIEKVEVEKAIAALWTICKIETPLEKYITKIGLENIFKGLECRKNGKKANKIQGGNYWEYLIAYDRFDYFPNSTLGYFYDAGQIFAFSKGLPTFEGSAIHSFLEKLKLANSTVKLPDIIKILETKEQLKGYVSQTTTADIKQYIVAPLYLMLRDEIRKSDEIAQTKLFKNLDYLKKFEDSFYFAVILLGAFFGFRKFYDPYYEALNLRFYKSFNKLQKEDAIEAYQEQVQTEIEIEKASKTPVETEKIDEVNLTIKTEEVSKTEEKTIENNTQKSKFNVLTDDSPTQKNKFESVSDILSQYRIIIEEAFAIETEIKFTEIAKLIKERTEKKITDIKIKNIVKQMDGIEIVQNLNQEIVRRKLSTGKLFDE